MAGHFGFSYIGLIFLLSLFIPNLIWTRKKPQGYTAEAGHVDSGGHRHYRYIAGHRIPFLLLSILQFPYEEKTTEIVEILVVYCPFRTD